MFETITTAAILYIATAVDLLVILLIFCKSKQLSTVQRYLYWTISRVINFNYCQFVLAYVLNYVPDKWILGLLGLIPIYLELRLLYSMIVKGKEELKMN